MEAPFTSDFFRRLQRLKIKSRKKFLGSRQGNHLSPKKGQGLEFADYRLYAPGDDFRHVDWGVYGRTDKLYVRQFQEEQDLEVSIFLDNSASMLEPQSKLELAKQVAITLSIIALTNGDSVKVYHGGQEKDLGFSGPQAMRRVWKSIMAIDSLKSMEFEREVSLVALKSRRPGKIFLISDFMFEAEHCLKSLEALSARSFDIGLIQILSEEELEPSIDTRTLEMSDLETGDKTTISMSASHKELYEKILQAHLEVIENHCSHKGASHLLLKSNASLANEVLDSLLSQGVLG